MARRFSSSLYRHLVLPVTSRSFSKSTLRNYSSGFSSPIVDALKLRPLLVREFINLALYHPKVGYFATKPEAVGVLNEPISFEKLEGRSSYFQFLQHIYKENSISWFTPVELFQPWYGYAIGRYILHSLNPEFPLLIYEIGGGTGTCARNILDFFKVNAPIIYESMTYISVEISEALAQKQVERVSEIESHRDHFSVECRPASNREGWEHKVQSQCFVIMLEVLDNMEHDLVYKGGFSSPWMQTSISLDDGLKMIERRQPIEDPLIRRCLDIVEQPRNSDSKLKKLLAQASSQLDKMMFERLLWIPTGCLELLETLHTSCPNMVLIATDFTSLPDVKVAGEQAPIVASKEGGITKDFPSYLIIEGNVDIFFPTDFTLLKRLDHHVAREKRFSSLVTSADFMKRFASTSRTQTCDGYNPLLEDYSNTMFYISGPSFG